MLIFSFFSILSLSGEFDDKIIVVFSCKEHINTNLKQLCQTWFKQIPEVHVYLDEITNEEAEAITKGNDRINVIFHQMKNTAPFLIGTGFDTPLPKSRVRNILAFKDIYKQYPDKKWYYFAQDDTFLLPHKFAKAFDQKDSNKPYIYGHNWYFYDSNYRFFSRSKTRLFYDIHAGYAIAQGMMKELVMNVDTIYRKYASPLIEEELKVSALADASVQDFFSSASNHMMWILSQSDVLKSQKERGYVGTDVASFSYMKKFMIPFYQATYCEWETNGQTKMTNFENYAGQKLTFEFDTYGALSDLTFGFVLKPFNNLIFASSPIKPVFQNNDMNTDPIGYYQEFGKIVVNYTCDSTLENGEMAANGAQGINDESISINIYCPNPEVIQKKQTTENFKILTYEYDWTVSM